MKRTNTYGRLERVTLEIYPSDLISLLEKAGEINPGFKVSGFEQEEPMTVILVRETPESEE